MPDLKLGLAPNKNGYFDPITNLYLSLDKPIQTVTYTDPKQLENITHALLATIPALVLFEGSLPQEAIDAWKDKYDKIFHAPKYKNIIEKGKVVGQAPIKDIVDSSIDKEGAVIKGNRAFDRADKAADVVGGESLGEVEQVELSIEQQEDQQEELNIEVQEAPAEKKKTTRTRKEAK